MDCMASCISCIQALRSSLELASTSIISGFSMPAEMRKSPRSSLATSRTISFCSEMTVERWSYRCEGVSLDSGWEGRGEGGGRHMTGEKDGDDDDEAVGRKWVGEAARRGKEKK